MALTVTPSTVNACDTFTVTVTVTPGTVDSAKITYDGVFQTVAVSPTTGTGTSNNFTAVGAGPQLIVATETLNNVPVATETATVTVNPAPAGTLSTTLTTTAGVTVATTTLNCAGSLATTNGTITYTVSGGGGTFTAPVLLGIVTPVPLGTLSAGQTVTAVFTPASGTCSPCSFAPVTVPVTPTSPLQAQPACWRLNLPFPFPHLFTATLSATVTPAQAGIVVSFFVGGHLVGTATTDASGTATLSTGLSVFQIISPFYTVTATINDTPYTSTATLLPCIPPI